MANFLACRALTATEGSGLDELGLMDRNERYHAARVDGSIAFVGLQQKGGQSGNCVDPIINRSM